MIEQQTISDFESPAQDETIREEKIWERHVLVNKRTVISSVPVMARSTVLSGLTTDSATKQLHLCLLLEKTTIPVPASRLYVKNGVVHLETMRITNNIALFDVDKDVQQYAIAAVEKQLQDDIFPQLRSLRRNYIDSVQTCSSDELKKHILASKTWAPQLPCQDIPSHLKKSIRNSFNANNPASLVDIVS